MPKKTNSINHSNNFNESIFKNDDVLNPVEWQIKIFEDIGEMNVEKLDEKIIQELQLELRWIPGVDPRNVVVKTKVVAGIATLFGHVTEPSIRRVAETATWRVLGIQSVSNQIKIIDSSIESDPEVGDDHATIEASLPGQQNSV